MRVRRPHYLVFEPRARAHELADLLSSDGPGPRVEWIAQAPHLGREVPVEAGDLAIFQALGPGEERPRRQLESDHGSERIDRLLAQGLLIGEGGEHEELARRDERLRDAHWWGPAALVQVFGRWDGVDVAANERAEGRRDARRLVEDHGPAPEACPALVPVQDRVVLETPARRPLDRVLQARATCRNFDEQAWLPADAFAGIMHRVYAAQDALELAPGATMLKKTSPSGGGLHPIEAFVLVQRVQGLAPGLYHYHCLDHALEPLAMLAQAQAAEAARELVAGQSWFANAPVLVLMAARFPRSYWKYPGHAKAWKVVQMDAGHLSQTLYLAATDAGLGAFVTGAINDAGAERLFGLDGLDCGAVAVSGFGARLAHATTREFHARRPAG